MNIAIDIGGIVGFRGGGIERVVVQLCQTMTRRFPKDQFYIFDLFGEGAFVKKIQAENVHHCYYFSGKNGALRKYRGEFQELLGVLVHNFISENQIDVSMCLRLFLLRRMLDRMQSINRSGLKKQRLLLNSMISFHT